VLPRNALNAAVISGARSGGRIGYAIVLDTSPAVFDPNLVTKGKKVPTDYFFFSLFFSLSFAFDPM